MADATNYLKGELIEWIVDGSDFDPAPTSLYVALHTDNPGDDADQFEVDAAGYSRFQTDIPEDWDIPVTGSFENTSDFVFDTAEEDWGDVSHFSLWDGPSDTDNALAQDSLLSTVTINDGDAPVFRQGNLSGTFE